LLRAQACVWLSLAVAAFGPPTLAAAAAQGPAGFPRGHVFFQADFEGTNALRGWTGPGRLETGYGSPQSLAVESRADAPGRGAVVTRSLPAELLRGYAVQASAMVRAADVSARPNPWNGVKFMLAIESPNRKAWPQAPLDTGGFDWQRARFTARVPADATAVTLVLGLEQVTGKVWFDDVRISVARPSVPRPVRPPAGPVFRGHDLPRLRGAMVSPNIDEAGLRVLGRDWNANLLRWQLIRHGRPGQPVGVEDYDAWLEGELRKLDAALPHCARHGLHVVVDLHSPPGGKATVSGYVGSDDRLFTDRACQEKFVEVWRRIAKRYRDARPIWGYDLANEPVETFVEEGCDDWPALAERATRAVRAIDPRRAIIVEPADWGGPEALRDFAPLPVSNVVYSVHMYVPGAFTHQKVHNPQGPEYRYPGRIEGRQWDKAQLEAALQPAMEFQRQHGVHLYIGEFSAIRWAPEGSAARYLKDVIEIFEAQGWDWSYHAFREWHGWSVEHGSDRTDTRPAATPTDRQRLLCEWFARNEKPRW
jgi:hypothetical protein